jgi:tRNA pseudouridine(55) synthase
MLIVYKNLGETPLECLERIRIQEGISTATPMTYAGRLDPLAEGALLLLVGEECKKKEEYLALDKEYEVEILLGIQTDSHDVLGLITKINPHENIPDFSKYICKFKQEYPAYSSKIISMKEKPETPIEKEVKIYSIDLIKEEEVDGASIYQKSIEKIDKVKGDFRQEKIKRGWQEFNNKNKNVKFKIQKIKVKCSSGTYMRSLAHNVGGLAFSIKRTKIGEYSV